MPYSARPRITGIGGSSTPTVAEGQTLRWPASRPRVARWATRVVVSGELLVRWKARQNGVGYPLPARFIVHLPQVGPVAEPPRPRQPRRTALVRRPGLVVVEEPGKRPASGGAPCPARWRPARYFPPVANSGVCALWPVGCEWRNTAITACSASRPVASASSSVWIWRAFCSSASSSVAQSVFAPFGRLRGGHAGQLAYRFGDAGRVSSSAAIRCTTAMTWARCASWFCRLSCSKNRRRSTSATSSLRTGCTPSSRGRRKTSNSFRLQPLAGLVAFVS